MSATNEGYRAIRIISAAPAVAELQLNELSTDYAPIVWNIGPSEGGIMVTAVLLHRREIARAQISNSNIPVVPGLRRQ